MGTAEIVELVSMGGHGVAALMFMFWREERKERIRYRDFHEETIKQFPKLIEVIQELKQEFIRERTTK